MIKFIGSSLDDTATMQECIEYCRKQPVLGLDIETSRKYPKNQYISKVYKPGLDPYLSRVVMLQIGTENTVFVIDTRRVDISGLKPILESESIVKVGHNLKFEYKHLLVNFGIRLRNVWDTMLVELILTNGIQMGYGLADLSVRYFNAQKMEKMDLFNLDSYNKHKQEFNEWIYDQEAKIYLDKSTRLGFIEIGDAPFTRNQIEYGADDILLPLRIRRKQQQGAFNYATDKYKSFKQKAKGWFPTFCIELENRFVLALAEIEVKGMHFNALHWMETYKKALPLYEQRKQKLNEYVVNNYPQFSGSIDLFSERGTCAIKWTSQKQVVDFFKFLDICPKERSKSTKRMEWTVGATAVFKQLTPEYKGNYNKGVDVEITDNQSLMLQYLLFKKSEQAVTTFGKDWLKYVHPLTKRVHSSYRQILNTGRISSVNPNLQNPPGNEGYRGAFNAPNGHKVVNTDYAAQEVRILAYVSQVQEMIDFFVKGNNEWYGDYHSYTATRVQRIMRKDPEYFVPCKEFPDKTKNPEFVDPYGKERNDAKSVTFKLSYGGTPYSLKDELGISEEAAIDFFKVYFAAFPGLKENFEDAKRLALKNRYIEIDPVTERRWWCSFSEEMDELEKKCWSYYPDNYRDLDPTVRADVKASLKVKHPELSGLWGQFMRMKGKLERNALNYRIQGLAAGMTKLAAIKIYERLRNADYLDQVWMNNLVHDEINAIATEEQAQNCATLIKQEMEAAGELFCKGIPMTASPNITDFWAH